MSIYYSFLWTLIRFLWKFEAQNIAKQLKSLRNLFYRSSSVQKTNETIWNLIVHNRNDYCSISLTQLTHYDVSYFIQHDIFIIIISEVTKPQWHHNFEIFWIIKDTVWELNDDSIEIERWWSVFELRLITFWYLSESQFWK